MEIENILHPIIHFQGVKSLIVSSEKKIIFSNMNTNINSMIVIHLIKNSYEASKNSIGKIGNLSLEFNSEKLVTFFGRNYFLITFVANELNLKMLSFVAKPVLQDLDDHYIEKISTTLQKTERIAVIPKMTERTFENKVIGQCVVGKMIGKGGIGEVYKGIHVNMGMKVAIKVLSQKFAKNKEYIKRFLEEGRILAQVDHENIAKIINLGDEQGVYYLIMRYIEGSNLQQVLLKKTSLYYKDVLKMAVKIADALQKIHTLKIVHRDLKPSNIIIEKSTQIPKIVDFGTGYNFENQAKEGCIVGTPLYMSPEQSKNKHIDHRSDIYSLGATLYHLLVGVPPFNGSTALETMVAHVNETLHPVCEKIPDIPTEVSDIITKMLQKKPENRYQSMLEFIEAIQEAQNNLKTQKNFIDLSLVQVPVRYIEQDANNKNFTGFFQKFLFELFKKHPEYTFVQVHKLGLDGEASFVCLELRYKGIITFWTVRTCFKENYFKIEKLCVNTENIEDLHVVEKIKKLEKIDFLETNLTIYSRIINNIRLPQGRFKKVKDINLEKCQYQLDSDTLWASLKDSFAKEIKFILIKNIPINSDPEQLASGIKLNLKKKQNLNSYICKDKKNRLLLFVDVIVL